jgi:hypothetical protein
MLVVAKRIEKSKKIKIRNTPTTTDGAFSGKHTKLIRHKNEMNEFTYERHFLFVFIIYSNVVIVAKICPFSTKFERFVSK